jgi:F-type H+-transporting ATPase subunit epsilon
MTPITLDLITPEKRVCQEPYDMVVLPGSEGEVGIMSQHQPFMLTLKEGDIRLYHQNAVVKTIPITGGFAEFSGEVCRVLADGVGYNLKADGGVYEYTGGDANLSLKRT